MKEEREIGGAKRMEEENKEGRKVEKRREIGGKNDRGRT